MDNTEFLNNLDNKQISKFIEKTCSDITIKRKSNVKVSDTSWIDMIEESIPYLDNIIRNPRRFIVQEENILPIEKTKVVTEEAIRHLAQNTGLIQEVNEDGTVIPLKLLNVYREETFDLYENRFIKSLVDNLYRFVSDKLNESDQKSFAKIDNNVTYQGVMKEKNAQIKINLTLESKIDREINLTKNGHTLDERISYIKEVLGTFRSSTFIKNLGEVTPVRSPIRKTNVILKEPNFKKALELWEFLEKNAEKPIVTTENKEEEIKDNGIKEKFDLAFFINSAAIDKNMSGNTNNNKDSVIIKKLVNDFVLSGDISEKEFKSILTKEFKEATKKKEKLVVNITNIVDKFVEDFDKNKKKAYDLIK